MPDPEVVRILCPRLTCRSVLTVAAEARGRLVRCPGCGRSLRVPLPRPRDEAPPRKAA